MATKRPKPEEIVVKLRQVEVLMGQGMPRLDAIRQIGVVEQTYSRTKRAILSGRDMQPLMEPTGPEKLGAGHQRFHHPPSNRLARPLGDLKTHWPLRLALDD